jgi:hypothetical protein
MTLDQRQLANQRERLAQEERRLSEQHHTIQKRIDALQARITDLTPYQPHQPDLKALELEHERAAIAAEMHWREEHWISEGDSRREPSLLPVKANEGLQILGINLALEELHQAAGNE